jgi:anti-sigma factor RsiW
MLCSRVQNLLSAYVDSELTGSETLQLRAHLRECSACRTEHDELRLAKSLLGALGAKEPARSFSMDAILASQSARGFTLPPRAQSALDGLWRVLASPISLFGQVSSPRSRMAYLTTCTALSVAVLAAAILQRPQPSDAVSAHVLVSLAADPSADRAPALSEVEELPISRDVVTLPSGYLPAQVPTRPAFSPAGFESVSYVRHAPVWAGAY